jgi:hypothetical protein
MFIKLLAFYYINAKGQNAAAGLLLYELYNGRAEQLRRGLTSGHVDRKLVEENIATLDEAIR